MIISQIEAQQFVENSNFEPAAAPEPITVLPFSGDGKPGHALIVSFPGNSNLDILLRGALADGLRSRGWKIDVATLMPSNATVSTNCDLVILGAPVLEGHAARQLIDCVDRTDGLQGKPIILAPGSQFTAEAMTELRNHVVGVEGRIVETLELDVDEADQTTLRMHDLEEVMHRAAERLIFIRRPIAARTY